MKDFIDKKGEFWFETDEEYKFCGKLIEKTNSFFLKTDINKNIIIPEKYVTIVGRIGNNPITLYKCSLTNNPLKKVFLVRYVFENYNNETKLNFNTINIKFHNLEEWIEKDSFDTTFENNSHIITPMKKKIPYKYRNGNVNFILAYSTTIKSNSFTIKNKYHIQLEFNSPQNFDEILKNINSLKNFLTLSMYNPTNIKNIRCQTKSSSKLNEINVYSKLLDYTPTEFSRYNSLLYFSDIELKHDIFERWFNTYDKYKPLFDIYFTNFPNNITIEYQFLSYTQALEAYMRKNELFKDYFIESKEYEIVKNELKEYVNNSIMSNDQKESWKNGKIEFGNEVSLRKRLKDLIKYLDKFDITKKITNGNNKKFIDDVVELRNYYTHYGHDNKPDIYHVISLTFNLKLLLELCILNELNFDKEFIDYTLNRVYERKSIII